MATIGSESVEVVPDARGFSEKLRAQLANLPSVQIKLDTTEAAAKLAALRAELETLRDKKLNVDDGGSSSNTKSKIQELSSSIDKAAANSVIKFTLIGGAILALIPLAAAASIAVAGIGAGIGLGIAGLLLGGLALGGVGSALSAGKAAKTGNTAQSAAQQAEQVKSAVNAQQQAEIALTVAQRNAAQAQRDLTQARIDAQNTLESLNNAVTDNALSQRQAAIDVANTSLALKTALASPDAQNPVNATALAQVQLAADQARQNQIELAESGTQAAQAAAKANALGVDGAANVVAAQNSVTDSTNAVAQAQYTVADSASKVALAQNQLASGAAAYQQALAKLDPAQRSFVKFLQSIGPELSQLKSAATNSFLPLLQTAITNLLPVINPIANILSIIGTGFGDLAVKASNFFTSPDGQKFLTFVQQNLAPAIDTLGKILGGFLNLGLSVFEAVYPLIQSFGDGLASALGGANDSVKNGALNGFLAYVKENGPEIKKTLQTVGTDIGIIIKALAPSGPGALKDIQQIADAFAKMAVALSPIIKFLIPFAPLILALAGAFKIVLPLLALFDVEADANPIGLIALAISVLIVEIIALIVYFKQVTDFLGGTWGTVISAAVAVFFPFIGLPALIVGHWKPLKDFFTGLWGDIQGAITTGVAGVVSFFNLAKSTISIAWDSIWNGLSDVVTVAFSDVASIVVDVVNGIVSIIDDLISGINGVITAANFLPGVNVKAIPLIPHISAPVTATQRAVGGSVLGHATRATGGPVAAGTPYWVGDGPGNLGELFVPSQSGYVLSHSDSVAAASNGGARDIVVYEAFNAQATAMTIERRLRFAAA